MRGNPSLFTSPAAISGLLQRTDLFGSLSDPIRAQIADRMRPKSFDSGQQIFQRGEEGRDVYLVVRGRVRLSIVTDDGRELAFAHATTGELFGEIAALDGGVRTADAAAMSKTIVMSLTHTALFELIREHEEVTSAVLSLLCRRLRETDNKLEAIALHSVQVRLARFLLSALKLKGADSEAVSTPIDLGISQGEIALLIGASRPKVNTAFSELEEVGAIERKGDEMVCHLEALREVASAVKE